MTTKAVVIAGFRKRLEQFFPAAVVASLEPTKQTHHTACGADSHISFAHVLFRLIQRVVRMSNEGFERVLGCGDTLNPFIESEIIVRTCLGIVRHSVLRVFAAHNSTSLIASGAIVLNRVGFVNQRRTFSFVGKIYYGCQIGTDTDTTYSAMASRPNYVFPLSTNSSQCSLNGGLPC